MKIRDFIKSELQGWGKYERVIFPLEIFLIIAISFYTGDDKIALISAICGISYTILAGKGKISCYIFGLAGTLCYAYLALKSNLFGNLFLYLLYYLPMQIVGIFKWKKHLKKDNTGIVKTTLSSKERFVYIVIATLASIIAGMLLKFLNDATPFMDAITTVFSIFGLLLTVKRCIEQWYVWFIVNGISVVMWLKLYLMGANCLATVIMWGTYVILSVYFLREWKRDIAPNKSFKE